MILGPEFFDRPTLVVARELVGKKLVLGSFGLQREVYITEAEAYDGFEDRASHAFRGKTPRNSVMFGPPGRWYVYFVYGMHEMLNVVVGPAGYPAAVLIRAGMLPGGTRIVGPARLTKFLGINREFNARPAHPESVLWIEDAGCRVDEMAILQTPRIGVDYAGEEWSKKPYRFVLSPDYTIT